MVLDIDESATPTIKKTQSNALWADASDFMYSMTSAGSIGIDNITKHAITGKTSGTYTLKATHKVTKRTKTFTVKVNKNAIIILPGFMGSTLVLNSNYLTYSKGDVFWDTSLTELDKADALVRIESLRCLLDGSSLVDLVVEQDNYGAGNYYQSLYKSLKDEYGENYEVSFFAYDWRMSNKVSAQDLNEYITENAYDKVVLVAHSMGGLVASSYLAIGETQQNKVQKLITLGSPLLGTPIAPYVWGSERVDVLLGGALGDVTLSWSELLLYVFAQQKNLINEIFGNFAGYGYSMVTEMEFDTEFWLAENLSEDTDSVVPAWSASLADKYADRTFYVKDMNHMGLVENPDIQEFVNRIIGGNVSVSGLDDIKEDLVMRE